ncbi:MAG: saccharopine dehydrogenase NADP-binding domain-containing protein [Sporichthyaceae bacterium]
MTWMIYGANGYTGRLVAALAVQRGHRPVLAGRDELQLAELADRLGLEHRAFPLPNPARLRDGLTGIDAVAHCAGPFSPTSRAMVDACLATGAHYVDITGEIDVLEAVLARAAEAREAGIALLPGSGFDVVPTDCLAAMVVERLPDATALDIAFRAGGGMSPGTARTSVEGLVSGGRARIDGNIVSVPIGWRRRTADFAPGTVTVTSIPWGDVSTAFHSTGVPDIVTYTQLPGGGATSVAQKLTGPAMKIPGVRRVLAGAVHRRVTGPDEARRNRSSSQVFVEARSAEGRVVTGSLTTPNGYLLTADSVVRVMDRVLAGSVPAGAHTPSQAHGPTFVLELDGVTLNGITEVPG